MGGSGEVSAVVSPVRFQRWLFWGLISQVQVLKAEKPDMWFNLFAPQGEDQVCEFPPDCGSLCWRLGLWRDCISASPSHFDVGFFFSP